MNEVRPEDKFTVLRYTKKENPVLTVMSLAGENNYIYMDDHWVHTASKYGLDEMTVDLFRRHWEFEPGDNPEWVSTNAIPDPENYWGVGELLAIFYFVIPSEVRRFEQFLSMYACVAPGGDILIPRLITVPMLDTIDDPATRFHRMRADLSAHAKERFRFIAAGVLKKGTEPWKIFMENNKGAIERRGHIY